MLDPSPGGACAIPASSVAWSQGAGRTGRIGILAHDRILDDSPGGGPNWRAFFDELAAGGFIEGTNLQVDRRRFGPTALDTVANELVRARPDVVFALATPVAHAVKARHPQSSATRRPISASSNLLRS